MAANPLIVCDPATSWYGFAYTLSWSNECEVAEVLSDIPFISVGILTLAVSVLFVVAKRVSLSAILLFSSVLLAFVAAVLDMGKTLADGAAINTAFIVNKAVITTREVLFAFSIGFRFLFYWSHVAEPPRRELSALSTQVVQKINFLALERSNVPHSGSWSRWGLSGKLLGVGLLVATIAITALQIVWRVAPQFHQYSSVYGTDAALQLLVSFLLLLKLLSNTLDFHSPDGALVHTFRECLAPISGLLVNIAIGVGGLLSFAFTESTIGRLLQAFEVCIVVIFVVAAAFLRHRDVLHSATSSHCEKSGDVPFKLPEPSRRSTFRITPPVIETPRMSTILGATVQNKAPNLEVLRWSTRRSLNHVSSWLSSRVSRIRARYEDEEIRLWNTENTKVDPPYTGTISVSSTQEPSDFTELLRDPSANANRTLIVSALDAQSALDRSMKGSIHCGVTSHPSRTDIQRSTVPPEVRITVVPVSSVHSPASSGVKHAAATPETSSVYDSRMSLDEVLRQQEQLDQNIEVLKLFSGRASSNSSQSTTSPKGVELSRSPSIGQRTVCSEVSLSSFPVPPWLTTPIPSLPSSRPTSVKRIRGDRRARFAATRSIPAVQDTSTSLASVSSALSIQSPPRLTNSVPRSPFGEENKSISTETRKSSLFGSSVTEYNVTSFIGGLATPGDPGQECQEKPWLPGEHERIVEAVQTSSDTTRFPPSMSLVPPPGGLPASPAATKLSPLARSPVLSDGDLTNIMQYRTSEQTPRAVVGPSSYTPATDAEKYVEILPTGPLLVQEIASPTAASGKGDDRAQRMFVRPRPPPLVIKTYTDQNPRVQVLADD